jgi:hypothetical protein
MLLDHGILPIAESKAVGPSLRMSRTTACTKREASSGCTRHPPSQPSKKKNRHGHRHGELDEISAQAQKIGPVHFSNLQLEGMPPNFSLHAICASPELKAQK